MILARHSFTDGRFHQTGQRWKHVDRRVDLVEATVDRAFEVDRYLSVVQLTIDVDLTFGNVSCQVRNRMGNIYERSEEWHVERDASVGLPSLGIDKIGI